MVWRLHKMQKFKCVQLCSLFILSLAQISSSWCRRAIKNFSLSRCELVSHFSLIHSRWRLRRLRRARKCTMMGERKIFLFDENINNNTPISWFKKKEKQECIIVKKNFFSDGSLTSCSLRSCLSSSSCFVFFQFFFSSFFSIIHFILFSSSHHIYTHNMRRKKQRRRTLAMRTIFLSSSWQRWELCCVWVWILLTSKRRKKKSEAHLVIIVCFEVNVHQCERVSVEEERARDI